MFTYKPDFAILPGVSLARILEKNNLSQKDLSLKTGLTEKHISNIIQGKASITEETAIKLEYVFGGAASFWINLQNNYDENLARAKFQENLKAEEGLIRLYPVRDLVKIGFLPTSTKAVEKLKELLKFFGVPSLKLVPQVQGVAYHQTAVKGKVVNQSAVAAWLRIGELEFLKVIEENKEIPEYNEASFKKQLPMIKKLTASAKSFAELPVKLREFGIVLVYSPYLPKTYISGALRWFGGRPLIQLNDHLQKADSFYFSLFHEFGHMILHDKRANYVDYENESKQEMEKQADKWASDILIDEEEYQGFIAKGNFSQAAIRSFAKVIGINKDIVIGRLAHDGKITWQERGRWVGKVIYTK